MPVYEYECKNCGKRFEKMQPITAEPLTECIHCGKGPVRRVFHPVGVIFKGSGWYITDNRKSNQSSSSASTSGSAAGSAGETSSSADGASSKKETTTAKKESGPSNHTDAD